MTKDNSEKARSGHYEIEIKAHVQDEEKLRGKIGSLFGEGRSVNKSDLYFHRKGEKHQAFRIRRSNGVLEFTAKNTRADSLSEENDEFEFFAPVTEEEKAGAFFECLGYEPYFRKSKTGFDWDLVQGDIHVELLEVSGFRYGEDTGVRNLGYFLEMEILIPFKEASGDTLREKQNKLHKVLHELGLREEDIEMKSYRSMILGE